MLSFMCCLSLVAASCGCCEQQQPKEKKIKVTVVAILASECDGPVDPALKLIAKEVQVVDPQLKRFVVASITNQTFSAGEKATIKLVENATAEVCIFCCGDPNDRVGVRVKPPLQGEIDYRAVCGKFLPLVTRYRTVERPSPCCVVGLLSQLSQSSMISPYVAAARLQSGCKTDRLILAIRVQECPTK